MLKGRSWLEFPFPGTFQNGHLEKMLKIENGNFLISAHNYHRITIFMSMYYVYVFEGAKHNEMGFENLTGNEKGQNPRWPLIVAKIIENSSFAGVGHLYISFIISSCPMILHGLSVILDPITYLD